jgi:hypothetical protein
MSAPLLPWPPAIPPDVPARRPSQPASRVDITPWEFQSISGPSLPTGLVEEVTPWELYPAPAPSNPKPKRSPVRRCLRNTCNT